MPRMSGTIETIANEIKRLFGREKSFVAPTYEELFPNSSTGLPGPASKNYAAYLETYGNVSWVYNCVKRIGQDVSSAPFGLFSGKDERIYKHPALDSLYKVNSQMTLPDLLEWTQSGLELTGNAYWLLGDIKRRGTSNIWPLIPSMVEIIKSDDPREFVKGYIYRVNGKEIRFTPEEIIHFKNYNPFDYHYGLAPLAAARMGVDTFQSGGRWNINFLNNSGRPDMAIVVPGALQPDQRARMRANWLQNYGGVDKAHGVVFLEKGAKPELIGVSQKDMDFIQQTKMSREDICSGFGVPPALVGLFEYANYANAEEQEKIYWRSTLVPKVNKICSILNEFFLPIFDTSGTLYFEVIESDIKALRADEEKRSAYVARYWDMGVPLDNLIDAYSLPFKKIKGVTNISYMPIGVIPAGEMSTDAEASAPKISLDDLYKDFDEAAKARTTPTRGQLKAKHHRFMLLAANLGKPMRATMRTYFDAQKDIILGALAQQQNLRPSMADLGISERELNEKLDKAMSPHIRRSVYEGRDSENLMLKEFTGKDAPKVGEKAVSRIEDWIRLKSFTWAENINQATLKRLQKVLDSAIAEGEGIAEISKRVAEVFDIERAYRTLRIAQTEVIASLNHGSIEAYLDNEMVERKGWLPAYDEVTREAHAQAGHTYGVRGAIPLDEDFVLTTGARGPAPGDMSLVGDVANCRCTIFPVTRKR